MDVYCTFILYQLQEIPSARSWAVPFRATGTVRKRQAVRPVHHIQNHTCRVALLQAGGPPCWASSLAFGLIGHFCKLNTCSSHVTLYTAVRLKFIVDHLFLSLFILSILLVLYKLNTYSSLVHLLFTTCLYCF
jgi:hypothetical protein